MTLKFKSLKQHDKARQYYEITVKKNEASAEEFIRYD